MELVRGTVPVSGRGPALAIWRKRRKHCVRAGRPLLERTAPNQEWALDFVHDAWSAGE